MCSVECEVCNVSSCVSKFPQNGHIGSMDKHTHTHTERERERAKERKRAVGLIMVVGFFKGLVWRRCAMGPEWTVRESDTLREREREERWGAGLSNAIGVGHMCVCVSSLGEINIVGSREMQSRESSEGSREWEAESRECREQRAESISRVERCRE